MKNRRIISLAIAGLFCLSVAGTAVWAQDTRPAKAKGTQFSKIDRIAEKLNLTGEQKEKLQEILRANANKTRGPGKEKPSQRMNARRRGQGQRGPDGYSRRGDRGPRERGSRFNGRLNSDGPSVCETCGHVGRPGGPGPRGPFSESRFSGEHRGGMHKIAMSRQGNRRQAMRERWMDNRGERGGERPGFRGRGGRGFRSDERRGTDGPFFGRRGPGSPPTGQTGRGRFGQHNGSSFGSDEHGDTPAGMSGPGRFGRSGGPGGPGSMLQYLDVTDDQREKIRDIMQSNPDNPREAISKVLTGEQKEQLKQRLSGMWSQKQSMRGSGGFERPSFSRGPGGPGSMLQHLDITDDQREKIRDIMQSNPDNPREAISKVLTDEQIEQFQQLRSRMQERMQSMRGPEGIGGPGPRRGPGPRGPFHDDEYRDNSER